MKSSGFLDPERDGFRATLCPAVATAPRSFSKHKIGATRTSICVFVFLYVWFPSNCFEVYPNACAIDSWSGFEGVLLGNGQQYQVFRLLGWILRDWGIESCRLQHLAVEGLRG